MSSESAAAVCPPVRPGDSARLPVPALGSGATSGTNGGDLDALHLELAAPFGAHKPRNVRPVELEAVARAIAAIEDDLEAPVQSRDRLALGMLAQVLVMQRRAFRVSTKGIETKAGNVRPIVQEFRALTRLVLDTLGTLRFRDGAKPARTLEAILAASAPQGSTNAAPAEPAPVESTDRLAGAHGRDDVTESTNEPTPTERS